MKRIITALIILVILWVYKGWFITPEIIGGDWPYFWNDFLRALAPFVPSWMAYQINGLGGPSVSYAFDSYLYGVAFLFVRMLGIPWPFVYKIAYFGLFIVLAYTGSRRFLARMIPDAKPWQRDLASVVYTTNTFILMIAGGGQLGIALAYATVPFVLASQSVITTGLWYGLLILFDARIALLTLGAHVLYALICSASLLRRVVIPSMIALLLHAGWILPMIVYRFTPYQYVLTGAESVGSLSFFSFADFSNAMVLLHPNWPENVFGKVYFLRPEFLFLPLIAFIGLLKAKNRNVVFLGLLGLVGAFFAKGTKEPFGWVNAWLFAGVPGFSIFRDPTKFYLYVALAYTALIPLGLSVLADGVAKRFRVFVIGIFLLFWMVTIREALLGQFRGTFARRSVPQEYQVLAQRLSSEKDFFRTIWYPRQQRFAYYTNLHPAVEANHFFGATTSAELTARLRDPEAAAKVQSAAIKYVIVPYDSEGELFTSDRKYDDGKWQQAVAVLDAVPWLTKKQSIGKIVVYEVPNPWGRFQLVRDGVTVDQSIAYSAQGTTRYIVEAFGPGELLFSERYDPSWKARVGEAVTSSSRTKEGYNSFPIPAGAQIVQVYFEQEYVYTYGRWVSVGTLVALVGLWMVQRIRKQ